MASFVDHLGKQFGKWTVLRRGKNRGRTVFWECVCECGIKREVAACNLVNGSTQSCGCLKQLQPARLRHGHSRYGKTSKEYRIWSNMKRRCLDVNNIAFQNYGGRGISVCKRWMTFDLFIFDMGICPEGHSLHRVNNNGNYCKSNCVWATHSAQANNTRRSIFVTLNGRTQTFTQWCDSLALNRHSAYDRIVRGWPPAKALTTPFRKGNYRRKPC